MSADAIAKKDLITYRDAVPSDMNFIHATWLPGLYHGNDWFRQIDEQTYYDSYPRIIESILQRPDVTVRIACLVEDADTILGYAVFEEEILHYAFVKEIWREIGIAKALIPRNLKWVTHLTKLGKILLHKKQPNVKFNPFI